MIESENPYDEVPLPAHFTKESFDEYLGGLESVKEFDDINISGNRNIVIKAGGSVYRVSKRRIRSSEVDILARIIGIGSNVPTDVRAMKQLDAAYQFTHEERVVYRYRVNISAMRSDGEQNLKIALRAIRAEIPSMDFAMIKEHEFLKMMGGAGLVIISGETGSGKTTTLAAAVGELIKRNGIGEGRVVCTYEQPVEYVYEPLIERVVEDSGDCRVEVYQHEIGADLPSFGEGVRNALRSNPDIIILGEARELETIDAALKFAMSGHLVFITTHAKGVVASLMRLVSEFPQERQGAALLSFLSCTKMIISQQLARKAGGGRIPVRESLIINEDTQREFAVNSDGSKANSMFVQYFKDNGITFQNSAQKHYDEGLIENDVLNFYKEI